MSLRRRFSTNLSSLSNHYDIVINGGGMIGSVLACKLAKNPALRNASILLLEQRPKKSSNRPESISSSKNKNEMYFSNRVSSLNESTKSLLSNIDVWHPDISNRCAGVAQMKVWGNASNCVVAHFTATQDAPHAQNLAYIVENETLIEATTKRLNDFSDRVQVAYESSVVDCQLPSHDDDQNGVRITLTDDSRIECSLLVGADGVNSKIRKMAGIHYVSWNYNQQAVVATLQIEQTEDALTAWQKFLPNGPVALLPLTSDICSLVWTTKPENAKNLLSLSDECFVDALNTALWEEPIQDPLVTKVSDSVSRLLTAFNIREQKEQIVPPTIKKTYENSRQSFPVGFGHAVSYVVPGVVLVGDAAHRVHPLAGQGVNLGFADVNCLDEILGRYSTYGAKLGCLKSLRDYETVRQRSNVPKMLAIDLIQKVAGHQFSPLLAATNAAFLATNSLPMLKRFFINAANS